MDDLYDDEKLRRWCLEYASNNERRLSPEYIIEAAEKFFLYIRYKEDFKIKYK